MNYYEILGVSQNASNLIIRSTYKTLMKEYHPDLSKDDDDRKKREEICKNFGVAFHNLNDPAKRYQHDKQFNLLRNYIKVDSDQVVKENIKSVKREPELEMFFGKKRNVKKIRIALQVLFWSGWTIRFLNAYFLRK